MAERNEHRDAPARPPSKRRRHLPHIEAEHRDYFVTFRTKHKLRLPANTRTAVLAHCLHDHQRRAFIYGVVVMPDHVHLVLAPLASPEGCQYPLAAIVGAMKGSSAHTVNRILGRKGHVWQDESFDHVLRSGVSAERKVDYICMNPVRRGLARTPDEYPWLWREWIEGRNPSWSVEASAEGG